MKEQTNSKHLFLEGELYYPVVHKPRLNPLSQKLEYTVLVKISDKAKLKELKDLGVKIHNKDNELIEKGHPTMGNYVKCKGTFAPIIVDSKLNVIPETILIGNGSVGVVKTKPYKDSLKPNIYHLGLTSIQVLKLIPYEANPLIGLESKNTGFTVPEPIKLTEEDLDNFNTKLDADEAPF